MTNKLHWETIYSTKKPTEVGWTQHIPTQSIEFITSLKLKNSDPIIDVGGGDSHLVDHLLELGFQDLTVLDISEAALDRAKNRLGKKAEQVRWICKDIRKFIPTRHYALWHDRACFHFLTDPKDQEYYLDLVKHWVDSFLVIGTFSDQGPLKCSGLEICRYSAEDLIQQFGPEFKLISSLNYNHITPFNTPQHYTFCVCARQPQVEPTPNAQYTIK